jgi:hypothetical protein
MTAMPCQHSDVELMSKTFQEAQHRLDLAQAHNQGIEHELQTRVASAAVAEQSLRQDHVHLANQLQERKQQVLQQQAEIRKLQLRSQEQEADVQAMLAMLGDDKVWSSVGRSPGCNGLREASRKGPLNGEVPVHAPSTMKVAHDVQSELAREPVCSSDAARERIPSNGICACTGPLQQEGFDEAIPKKRELAAGRTGSSTEGGCLGFGPAGLLQKYKERYESSHNQGLGKGNISTEGNVTPMQLGSPRHESVDGHSGARWRSDQRGQTASKADALRHEVSVLDAELSELQNALAAERM